MLKKFRGQLSTRTAPVHNLAFGLILLAFLVTVAGLVIAIHGSPEWGTRLLGVGFVMFVPGILVGLASLLIKLVDSRDSDDHDKTKER